MLLCLLLVVLGRTNVVAQFHYGVRANVSLSWMPSTEMKAGGWQGKPWLGPELGGFLRHNYNVRLFAEAQLNYVHSTARQRLGQPSTTANGTPGDVHTWTWRSQNIDAIGLPILLGYYSGWGTLMVGVQCNTHIAAKEYAWVQNVGSGHARDYGGLSRILPFKPFDFGLRAGIVTGISRHFGIELGYFHGLTNLQEGHLLPRNTWKLRQITYGLRIDIGKR